MMKVRTKRLMIHGTSPTPAIAILAVLYSVGSVHKRDMLSMLNDFVTEVDIPQVDDPHDNFLPTVDNSSMILFNIVWMALPYG